MLRNRVQQRAFSAESAYSVNTDRCTGLLHRVLERLGVIATPEKLLAELARPEPAFVTKVMSDLLPDEDRRRYAALTMKARIAMG